MKLQKAPKKTHDLLEELKDNHQVSRLATIFSMSVALLLATIKLVAWIMTGSVAILSSLIDSLLDFAGSLVTFFAVKTAYSPPDKEHSFGHGKAEPIASLIQAGFITGSALLLMIEAFSTLFEPTPIKHHEIGIAVIIISILATFFLISYQRWVIKKTDSIAIKGDYLHYVGDLLTNIAVILAILGSVFLDLLWLDPLFGILIGGYLIFNAYKIGRNAIDMLMDHELPLEDRERIMKIAYSHQDVLDLHDLKTRRAGPLTFIQMHIGIDQNKSLKQAHDVADWVEKQIMDEFPGSDVIVHQDPE